MNLQLWDKENQSEYNYSLAIFKDKIVSEKFLVRRKKTERFVESLIFSRHQKRGFKFGVESEKFLKDLEDKIRDDTSAVSVFSKFNHSESKRLLEMVSPPNLIFSNIGSHEQSLRYAFSGIFDDNKGNIDRIVNIVKRADLSILDIEPRQKDTSFNLSKDTDSHREFRLKTRSVKAILRRIVTTHQKHKNGRPHKTVEFDLDEDESRGTQMFIGLITAIIESLESGGVIVMDELGTSLHPFLSKMIVDQFNNQSTNPKKAQLIFNSHEIYLLNKETGLRRDQIWLVDKNKYGESYLKRMSEYKTRKDFSIDTNYLSGRFGAVPFVDYGDGVI